MITHVLILRTVPDSGQHINVRNATAPIHPKTYACRNLPDRFRLHTLRTACVIDLPWQFLTHLLQVSQYDSNEVHVLNYIQPYCAIRPATSAVPRVGKALTAHRKPCTQGRYSLSGAPEAFYPPCGKPRLCAGCPLPTLGKAFPTHRNPFHREGKP